MSTAGQGHQTPPWWAALPPASVRVPCGDGTHQLRWEQGRLVAADHPDAEAELVLAALGGDRTECIELAEAWGSRSDDLEVLAVGPRSAADELTITRDEIDQLRLSGRGRMGFRGSRPMIAGGRGAARSRPSSSLIRATGSPGPAARSRTVLSYGTPEQARTRARQAELLSLLTLSPELALRLAGTVAAAWADGGRRADDRAAGRPALVAALTGRLAPAAGSWLGIDPGQVEVTLHEDAGWGRLAVTGSGSDRKLRAALPAGWLASVWAAGLAVTGGHLIVAVQEAAWPGATVLGVPEPGAEPVILKVHVAGGNWAVGAADGEGAADGGQAATGGHGADGQQADRGPDGSEHDDGTA